MNIDAHNPEKMSTQAFSLQFNKKKAALGKVPTFELQQRITKRVRPHLQTKVACTVWWDFVADNSRAEKDPRFRTNAWFRRRLDEYKMENDEPPHDELYEALVSIGYEPKNAAVIIQRRCNCERIKVDQYIDNKLRRKTKHG